MLCLTRADFNNILNFNDLRATELTLTVNHQVVPSRDIVKRFVSNTDIALDRVAPEKVAERILEAESFLVEVQKPYPFHEALIRPCLDLSSKHRHGYVPNLWAGRKATLVIPPVPMPELPVYAVVFESQSPGQRRMELLQFSAGQVLSIEELTIGALYVPSAELQHEVVARMDRIQRIKDADIPFQQEDPAKSESQQEAVIDEALLLGVLRSLWPCGAMGRLPTYLHLREGTPDVRAHALEVSTGGRRLDGRLADLYEEVELEPGIVSTKAPNGALDRSARTDALAIKGMLEYRAGDWATCAGWPLYVAAEDPTVSVRSNGVVRWMRMSHGLFESIERIADGRNLALGARRATDLYANLMIGRRVLYGGLGLGVVQRSIECDSSSLTCEVNQGVISAFNYIFPEHAKRLNVIRSDIFEYVRRGSSRERFAVIFLDLFDPDDRCFQEHHLRSLLEVGGTVIVNRHVKDDEDRRHCSDLISRLPFRAEEHVEESKQLICKFDASDMSSSHATLASRSDFVSHRN